MSNGLHSNQTTLRLRHRLFQFSIPHEYDYFKLHQWHCIFYNSENSHIELIVCSVWPTGERQFIQERCVSPLVCITTATRRGEGVHHIIRNLHHSVLYANQRNCEIWSSITIWILSKNSSSSKSRLSRTKCLFLCRQNIIIRTKWVDRTEDLCWWCMTHSMKLTDSRFYEDWSGHHVTF